MQSSGVAVVVGIQEDEVNMDESELMLGQEEGSNVEMDMGEYE